MNVLVIQDPPVDYRCRILQWTMDVLDPPVDYGCPGNPGSTNSPLRVMWLRSASSALIPKSASLQRFTKLFRFLYCIP